MSELKYSVISKKRLAVYLIIILLGSLGFKFYLTDFSVPETGDSWIYILRGIANSQGDYVETPEKTQGWNLFLSPFFSLTNSNNYLDYVNIARILSISISVITIIPMFFLARKFFSEKYSILCSIFLGFQPQLHYNASLGFSEPLFILTLVSASALLIDKKITKTIFIAFLLLGALFWTRFIGLIFIIPFIISYFILYYKSTNKLKIFFLCLTIFLIVISPILSLRYIQYDDPLYYWNPIPIECCDNVSIIDIILQGGGNTLYVLGIVSLPYLIFLIPIGMFFSFKKIKNKENRYLTNWIILISTTLPFFIANYALTNEARHMFHLYPFLIIFATLAVNEILECKKLLFTNKQKNYIIYLVIILVLISSGLVTIGIDDLGYGRTNTNEIHEIQDYSKFLINNVDGKLFWSKGVDSDWVWVTMLTESNGEFKNYKNNPNFQLLFSEVQNLNSSDLYVLSSQELSGDSIEKIISKGKIINLSHLSVSKYNEQLFFDDVYQNEVEYPYLVKIFDSREQGYNHFSVKTFEIDYSKFEN
tara:strand:+ start:14321 stop:15922 length:1602 start_codon:yes stop_codon:yes gene_type:complete